MVTIRNRRGGTGLGCLFTTVLFSAALYYGVHIGEVYWRYYQMVDEMDSQARLAPSLTDAVIRRRVAVRADELNITIPASRIRITREFRPRRIVVEGAYRDSVDLPLLRRAFDFRPRAEAPL